MLHFFIDACLLPKLERAKSSFCLDLLRDCLKRKQAIESTEDIIFKSSDLPPGAY